MFTNSRGQENVFTVPFYFLGQRFERQCSVCLSSAFQIRCDLHSVPSQLRQEHKYIHCERNITKCRSRHAKSTFELGHAKGLGGQARQVGQLGPDLETMSSLKETLHNVFATHGGHSILLQKLIANP